MHYFAGAYDSVDAMAELDKLLTVEEERQGCLARFEGLGIRVLCFGRIVTFAFFAKGPFMIFP